VRWAYKEKYGREMVDRVKGEVRKGGYRDLLVMLLGGGA
jgi:protein subunit release factor B